MSIISYFRERMVVAKGIEKLARAEQSRWLKAGTPEAEAHKTYKAVMAALYREDLAHRRALRDARRKDTQ
jgi:hypothetical protein